MIELWAKFSSDHNYVSINHFIRTMFTLKASDLAARKSLSVVSTLRK